MIARGAAEAFRTRLERTALNPLNRTGQAYYVLVAFLAAIVVWGAYAFFVQLRLGLGTTGMGDQVVWGLYIVNFVFFLGIAMAGTVISAILRITGAGWRTPITRIAELVTVTALMIGGIMPVIDLGRPDRVASIFVLGRFQSAIMWDIIVITTYLTGSLIYFYLPMIPDIAWMRDKLAHTGETLKYRVFVWLAVGYQGTPVQKERLHKAEHIMSIAIVPMAVMTHTVASLIFAWMLRPGWNSTIYGVYFVIGAVFSGIGTVILVLVVFRKFFHLEEYLTEKHFRYLSYMLIAMLLAYAYLVLTEYLTVAYPLVDEEKHLLEMVLFGSNAIWFWTFVFGGLVIPLILLVTRRGSPIPRIAIAAALVNVAMWLKRFIIVVPSQQVPLLPYEFGTYAPSWIEWAITAAAVAAFALVFAIAAKVMPMMPITELSEEKETETPEPARLSQFPERTVALWERR
jgi:molybdopterin-containing oxidoreductase family membrane subunit